MCKLLDCFLFFPQKSHREYHYQFSKKDLLGERHSPRTVSPSENWKFCYLPNTSMTRARSYGKKFPFRRKCYKIFYLSAPISTFLTGKLWHFSINRVFKRYLSSGKLPSNICLSTTIFTFPGKAVNSSPEYILTLSASSKLRKAFWFQVTWDKYGLK